MKYDDEIEEIVCVWAENVRDNVQELKDHLAFCKADYEMYARLINDTHAVRNSPQYMRLMESKREFVEKFAQHMENVEKVLKIYPNFADLFADVF